MLLAPRPDKAYIKGVRPFPSKKNANPTQDNWIWGEHSVEACLETKPEDVLEVFIEKKATHALSRLGKKLDGFQCSYVEKLPRFLAEKRTQGVAAKIKEFPIQGIEKFYEKDLSQKRQVLILDRIQDIQNFGAILRSAAALGAQDVIIGSREQAPVNGTVAQVSAGNIFKLNIYVCHNLAKTCEKLKDLDFELFALDSGGVTLEQALASSLGGSIGWILGSEEDGIQNLVLKIAHKKVGIPMSPGVESLNVSNSAAIALYAGSQKLKA